MSKRVVVAITGASGAAYAQRLLQVLAAAGCEIYLSISPAGQIVIRQELGLDVDLHDFRPASLQLDENSRLQYCFHTDLMAPIASGSFLTDGMVVCPCSGTTLASIAHSLGSNLIHRAAEVHLKERRKLILVPRETPLSLPHLDNMRRAAEAGAVVLPASPGFYHGPKTIGDLVDFVVARICDQLGVQHSLMKRWGEEPHNSSKNLP